MTADPSRFEANVTARVGLDVLDLTGELDLTNAELLSDKLELTSAATVVVDLSGITFIDSAGMHAIDRAYRRFSAAGRAFFVVAPPQTTAGRTLAIAGYDGRLVVASPEQAGQFAADGLP